MLRTEPSPMKHNVVIHLIYFYFKRQENFENFTINRIEILTKKQTQHSHAITKNTKKCNNFTTLLLLHQTVIIIILFITIRYIRVHCN